jgi:hypothetical protein
MNHKVLLTFALIAFMSVPSAVLAAVGLLCPSQDEPPRIIIVDIEGAKIAFFSLANGTWGYKNELSVHHDKVRYSMWDAAVEINRKTMILTTDFDADMNISNTERILSCSVHTLPEVELIAAREWERISNSRGF